ncbi:acyl-CoA N-acyltransferase [Scheffersomyces coipomensis]|uniref:acyl-CoA N-acyltransferase n=1 Tax=Scheffersomyces coipomensis TaxID=1788519 RepID=UPI00315D5831
MSSNAALTAASLQPELWTSSSNETLKLFVTNSEGAINFQPVFTYPIFGDSETIYGYKDLVIFLCFDHYTFYPFLNIKYTEKLNDPEIIDIKETIDKFLPESTVYKDEVKWVDLINEEKKSYKIPGELIESFEKEVEGEVNQFEIYKLDLQSISGLELHKRLQILVLLFIEAGSYIDAKDELWNVYVLYNTTNKEEPSIVGFTTVYNYFKYPGFEKFDNEEKETRLKISQFIILPTYQGQRLGGEFYARLFNTWYEDPNIIEIVVEDPNESFDDLRDRSDFIRLNSSIKFDDINSKLDSTWIKDTRSKLKLEKRQFSRLLELTLLYKLKYKLGNDSKKDVRLFIKKRLFEKNREGLEALDENNRKDKLQTAYESLEQDYYRILGDIKFATKRQLEV